MIRVLMVEDSVTMAALIRACLESADDIEVVGHAVDGAKAVELAAKLKPDLITMDVVLPKMNGVEATRRIMSTNPIPIVVISSHVNDSDMQVSFDSLNAGAVSVIEKPQGLTDQNFEASRKKIVTTVRAMAGLKLVRRREQRSLATPQQQRPDHEHQFDIVAIGVSTGEPNALTHLDKELTPDYPLPILVTQHISPGFTVGFAQWLNDVTPLKVSVAQDGEQCEPGHIYVAPDDRHMALARTRYGYVIRLRKSPPVSGFRPSVSVMFEGVAQVAGKHAVGIILTGMGRDGANGLLKLKDCGGYTIGQGRDSCVVYGMSAVAKEIGAVTVEKELAEIGPLLNELVKDYQTDGAQ